MPYGSVRLQARRDSRCESGARLHQCVVLRARLRRAHGCVSWCRPPAEVRRCGMPEVMVAALMSASTSTHAHRGRSAVGRSAVRPSAAAGTSPGACPSEQGGRQHLVEQFQQEAVVAGEALDHRGPASRRRRGRRARAVGRVFGMHRGGWANSPKRAVAAGRAGERGRASGAGWLVRAWGSSWRSSAGCLPRPGIRIIEHMFESCNPCFRVLGWSVGAPDGRVREDLRQLHVRAISVASSANRRSGWTSSARCDSVWGDRAARDEGGVEWRPVRPPTSVTGPDCADEHPDAVRSSRRAAELVAHITHRLRERPHLRPLPHPEGAQLGDWPEPLHLSRIEAGSHWPDISSVMKVCAALGLRVELVDGATGQAVVIHNPPPG